MNRLLRDVLLAWVVVITGCCAGSRPPVPVGGGHVPPETESGFRVARAAHAARVMVSSAHGRSTEAGLQMLKRGGSAVDAAVAVQAMLTLVEPQSSGIGGGGFMLHWDGAAGDLDTYDGRETAPAAATPDLFLDPDGQPLSFPAAMVGGRSVGVPGVLRMLELAHQEQGRLPWAELFTPAIAAAESGFQVSERLHRMLAADDSLRGLEPARFYFYQPDGSPKPVGAVLRNPELAETLRRIAAEGAAALYTGQLAAAVVAAVQGAANPGRLTGADLAGYRAVKREPLCLPYRRYRLCGAPPPTAGGITTLQILAMLERFDMASLSPLSPQAVHLLAEAERLAYADRDHYVADPAFVSVPTETLLDPTYLQRRSALIDGTVAGGKAEPGRLSRAHSPEGWAPDRSPERPSTSHFSIADAYGNVVSMTTSIEHAFGSRLMVRGFMLNNQLTDFSFRPLDEGRPVANAVGPGKRPRSSMAPMVVLDRASGQPVLALGSPGGSRIIGYVARVLVAVLDAGLDVQAALDLPHVLNRNGKTEVESHPRYAAQLDELSEALAERGHDVQRGPQTSGVHAIAWTAGGLVGAVDPRREGVAQGD